MNRNISFDSEIGDDPIVAEFKDIFTDIVPVESTGTTCDAFQARLNGRRIFIKRLKTKYIDNIKYIEAFRKEYEIGSRLSHKSLPVYANITLPNSIITDYIDGFTLAELIKNQDPWLRRKANIRKMLFELVDVVDYLHQNDIVHSDIKADNIMLTKASHSLILIDLDKCRTGGFDRTAGNPRLYGVAESEKYKDTIDFNGIGMLVQTLSLFVHGFPAKTFRKFEKACFKKNIIPDELREILRPKDYTAKILVAVATITAASAIALVIYHKNTSLQTIPESVRDTVVVISEPTLVTEPLKAPELYRKTIAQELHSFLKPIDKTLKETEAMLADSTASYGDLYDAMLALTGLFSETTLKAYSHFESKYPEVSPSDIQIEIARTDSYIDYSKKIDELVSELSKEINRRQSANQEQFQE